MDWTVYILECADGSFYTGITNNLHRRISQHEAGRGAKYTKGRGPFRLAYSESCIDRSAASKREQVFKNLNRAQKQAFLKAAYSDA